MPPLEVLISPQITWDHGHGSLRYIFVLGVMLMFFCFPGLCWTFSLMHLFAMLSLLLFFLLKFCNLCHEPFALGDAGTPPTGETSLLC